MKTDIHPKWHPDAKVTCSCGNTFSTGSTLPEITVDICSACHPFFTGEMRFVDVQGRVEKFQAKQQKAKSYQGKKPKRGKKADKTTEEPKTLKEMLGQIKTQTEAAPESSPQKQ